MLNNVERSLESDVYWKLRKKNKIFCTYANLKSMAPVSSFQAYIAFNFSLYKNFEMKFPFERYISGLD